MEKMTALYEKVAKDSALQAKFNEIMAATEKAGKDATGEKLTAFAEEAGYDITLIEIQEFFKKLAEKKEGELSDLELDSVAGGKSGNGIIDIVSSVVSLGVACAAGSTPGDAPDGIVRYSGLRPGDCPYNLA